ncbi:MAG: hypothetical protein A2157_17275 [Deltaproteobacteria bacterium RBG_16_47_11]|nr:MAG: hypothetical protein A2157_17275 [Deltaproteobacteria bacterium RBG_16_47_11]
MTWGQRKALQNRWNDAFLARKLCETLEVPHEYFVTDLSAEPIEKIFRRFLTVGEGRIDHIAAYMDGFGMWRTFSDNGIKGVIRGDECFGSPHFRTESEIRDFIGATMFSDFVELSGGGEFRPNQKFPAAFLRRGDESLEAWRDRMYIEYLFPYGISALNDLKLPYVEIMAPFVSRSIVERMRRLPDLLRTGKTLFKKIVRSRSPSIPFAKYPAIDLEKGFLRNKRVTDFLLAELESSTCAFILPSKLMNMIKTSMRSCSTRHSPVFDLVQKAKPFVPARFIPLLKRIIPSRRGINPFDLSLRLFIVGKMNEILSDDAIAWQRDGTLETYTPPHWVETEYPKLFA